MKLLSFTHRGSSSVGFVIGSDVLDVRHLPSFARFPASAIDIGTLFALGEEAVAQLRSIAGGCGSDAAVAKHWRDKGALLPIADVRVDAPVSANGLLLSAAMNYHGHLAEMGGVPAPLQPAAFLKVHSAVIASGQPIVLPVGHDQMVDWEGEFCAVIGRAGRNIREADALDYVFGYTLMNDVSAREFVSPFLQSVDKFAAIQTWERNVMGKNYPTFCPIGPVVVTKDELPDPSDYRLETLLNGEVVQSVSGSDLVFKVQRLVSYYSSFYGVKPGDIISTGSPAGVGMMKKPPRFLRVGDLIEVRVAEIGTLSNGVISHDAIVA